jgi:DMSO/TMAO reductase YedYZ molybdopterin-dependent catalytic subunit
MMSRRGISRRSLLVSAVAAAGAAAAGMWAWNWSDESPQSPGTRGKPHLIPSTDPFALVAGKLLDTDFPDPFAGGELLGYLPFDFEGGNIPGQRSSQGHNARLIIDVASLLMPASRLTPADAFFIRTEYPDLLRPADEWTLQLGGEVRKPQALPLSRLDRLVEPKGPVLLECSGNHRSLKFGLLSVAEWEGIPIGKVLDLAGPTNKASSVLIKGFDEDSNLPDNGPPYSEHSLPTCRWIFTREQLEQAGAFLATRMNGQPLPKDHGKPVRLVVPGWYGCTEVKWVNEIKLVDDNQPATLQMLEFADRTGQKTHPDPAFSTRHPAGPKQARDYVPASIDQAAIPVRVEQWKLNNKLAYRVVGITWGGPNRSNKLKIRLRRLNRDPAYRPIDFCKASTSVPSYGIWMHRWDPKQAGRYSIDVRLDAPNSHLRRLDELEPLVLNDPQSPIVGRCERVVRIPAVDVQGRSTGERPR